MYDVVTGVSVGSINAIGIALHKVGEEKAAVEWIHKIWRNINASNIFTDWPNGILEGLIYREGLWNNHPGYEYLKALYSEFDDPKVHRKININTWDFETGEIFRYNETSSLDKIALAVVASASIPAAFSHTHLDNHVFVDGGVVWNLDLAGAIDRCREVVDDDSDIIIDTILWSGVHKTTRDEHKSYNTLSNYIRYREITKFYNTLSDYEELKRGYININFRYLVFPESPLPSDLIPLGFDKKKMNETINIGYEDAKKAIKNGPKFNQYRATDMLIKNIYQGIKAN